MKNLLAFAVLSTSVLLGGSAQSETIKAKIGGGLYQGPRQFVVVDIDGKTLTAKYVENVTTWCPFQCPWYDHPAVAYQACPLRLPGDFSAVDPSRCITAAGKSITFPDVVNPDSYSIKFQYKKGGLIQEKEFVLGEIRKRQLELNDPSPSSDKSK